MLHCYFVWRRLNVCSLVLLEKEFDAFWLDELVTMSVLLLNEDVFITQAA
jgi:hypothetical protein